MQKRHKLPNGDTIIVNDEITSRFDALGLPEESRDEILQRMTETIEGWASLEVTPHPPSIPARLGSMASRAVARLAHR